VAPWRETILVLFFNNNEAAIGLWSFRKP